MMIQSSYTIVALLLPVVSQGFTNVGFPLTRPTEPARLTLPEKMRYSSPSSLAGLHNHKNRLYDNNSNDIIDADVIDKKKFISNTENTFVNETTAPKKQKLYNHGIHPIIRRSWNKIRTSMKKPSHKLASLMAAAFIMIAVVFTPLSEAFAAPSGGRMGGSFGGSSRSSYSRSSYSRSYSSPSRSYGGYNARSFSRPNIIVAPSIGTNPYYGYGYNYGPGGVAVVRRGPSIVDIMLFGVLAMVLFNAFSNVSSMTDEFTSTSALGPGVSVCQISVALNVPQKDSPNSILTFLNRLSRTARTDTRVGVSNLVSQVALELLRQRRSVFAASSKFTHYRDSDKAQRDFSTLAIKERSKFERESTSNYGGVDYAGTDNYIKSPSLVGDTYTPQATAAVVTIILSIDGDSTKLPTINSVADLEQALTRIASDSKVDDCLRSAEVLWTPEDSKDTLNERDVIVDYPELRTI